MPDPARQDIAIIAAVARNGIIGRGNALPWHLPEDLRRFKRLTLGAPVIMGRRTFDSIGRALPGRLNIVVSRNPRAEAPGCTLAGSLGEALAAAGAAPVVFVIGGSSLYAAALPVATRMYLTEIDADVEGDTRFPDYDRGQWRETGRETHEAGPGGPALHYAFVDYERI
jgi:dihydrofolate reductase